MDSLKVFKTMYHGQIHIDCQESRKIKQVLFCETRFLYSTLLIIFNGKIKRRRANDIVFSARNRLDRIEREREREREREKEREMEVQTERKIQTD